MNTHQEEAHIGPRVRPLVVVSIAIAVVVAATLALVHVASGTPAPRVAPVAHVRTTTPATTTTTPAPVSITAVLPATPAESVGPAPRIVAAAPKPGPVAAPAATTPITVPQQNQENLPTEPSATPDPGGQMPDTPGVTHIVTQCTVTWTTEQTDPISGVTAPQTSTYTGDCGPGTEGAALIAKYPGATVGTTTNPITTAS